MCGQAFISMANTKLIIVLVSIIILPLFATTESTNRAIPRLIFRTSFEKYDELHPNLVQINQQTIQRNPSFMQIYFGQDDITDFIGNHFPHYLRAYNHVIPGAFQADIFRLMVLYVYGGIYADMGYQFLEPIESFIDLGSDEFVAAKDRPGMQSSRLLLSQGVLAAYPKHPFVKYAIEWVMNSVSEFRYNCNSLDVTGPRALGLAFNAFLNRSIFTSIPGDRNVEVNGHKFHFLTHVDQGGFLHDRGKPVIKTKFDEYGSVMYQRRHVYPYYSLWAGWQAYDVSPKDHEKSLEHSVIKHGKEFLYIHEGKRVSFPNHQTFAAMGMEDCAMNGYRSLTNEELHKFPVGEPFSTDISVNAARLVPKLAPLNTSHADQLAKNIDAKFLEKAATQASNSTLSYSQWITLIARHRGLPYFYEWDKSFGGFMRQTYTASQCPLPPVRLQPGYVPPPEKFRSHSQVQQDISVLSLTHDKPNGFYIDLAANDYQEGSNTYVLDRFNQWRGVCVEPNAKFRQGLMCHRTCAVVINPVSQKVDEEVTFRLEARGVADVGGIVGDEFDNHNDSTAKSGVDITMYTTTLTHVLDLVNAPKRIDYMSLDIEGAEYHALKGFDFRRYTIDLITVERPKEKTHQILAKNGYWYVYTFSGGFGECLYVHESKSDFRDIMLKYRTHVVPVWFNDITQAWIKTPHAYMIDPAWSA